MSSKRKFRLDRDHGKVLGVCARIADHFDVDLTLVRVGMAVAIIATFPVVLFGYFLLAMVADNGGRRHRRAERVAAPQGPVDRDELRQRMRDIDARMQAIETHVTGANTRLAQEIEALR